MTFLGPIPGVTRETFRQILFRKKVMDQRMLDIQQTLDLIMEDGHPETSTVFFLSWDLVIVVGGIQGTKCSRMFPLNGNRSTQRRGAKNHKSTVAVANTVDW